MPGESVKIFEANRRKASERDSTKFNLSVILAFVTFKGLALYRENTVQMHAQNGVYISLIRDIINDKFK